jgi:uncharacterized protein (DUF885 family)
MKYPARIRTVLGAGVLVAVAMLAHPHAQPASIDDFFRSVTDEWMRTNPNAAISARYFTGETQDALEAQMTPWTREWRQQRVALARRALADLKKFDRTRFTAEQRLSADLMAWQLQVVVDGEQYQDFSFPLEQFNGANIDLPNALTVVHPLNDAKDAANYLRRLAQVGTRMDEAVADARRIADKGMIPPRFILRATATQMRQFIGSPPAQNPLVTAFTNRIGVAVPAAARESLRAEAEKITAGQVYPAWQRAIAFLEPLAAKATDDAGLSRFKDGDKAYAYALRRFTTTELGADEIHRIGLREVARIEAQMDGVLRKLGRTTGSVSRRIAQLQKDRAYPLNEVGRTQIMTDIAGIIGDAQQRSAALFERAPHAPVEARAFPRFRENNAAANYTAPSPDGSRPGVFQIPLRPARMTKFGLRSLIYHETVPGHHFQIGLELENRDAPRFRQIRAFGPISALNEGWALYAEQLAAEAGWYDNDLEGLLGQLDAALFRARRLVVDTGIHTKGWTRQQAIDYGIEASEVERYVVNPGQACSYMLGRLKLLELRDKTQKALGSRYSPQAFHSAVLMTGTVPLPLLEQQVVAYLLAARAN